MSDINQDESSICVAVPGYTAYEGLSFLESVAAGNIGGGIKMTRQGQTIPQIRTMYKSMIEKFEADLTVKKNTGLSAKELARWAVNERTKIAHSIRAKQGGAAQIVLELRDNIKYGAGGRSYDNLAKRSALKGVQKTDIPAHLLKNATKPNQVVSKAALKGAKFLKHGGRAVVVVSITMTAYTLLTAPEGKLEQIFYEEMGGAAGGVIGGGIGGVAGSEAGTQVYLLKDEYVRNSKIGNGQGFDVYDPEKFMKRAP